MCKVQIRARPLPRPEYLCALEAGPYETNRLIQGLVPLSWAFPLRDRYLQLEKDRGPEMGKKRDL